MNIQSRDGLMGISLNAHETGSDTLPDSSCFDSLADSSAYSMGGSIGYSVTQDCCRLDGIRLETQGWRVRPLEVENLESTFFRDRKIFPEGSI